MFLMVIHRGINPEMRRGRPIKIGIMCLKTITIRIANQENIGKPLVDGAQLISNYELPVLLELPLS
jgi:hypothetical protein